MVESTATPTPSSPFQQALEEQRQRRLSGETAPAVQPSSFQLALEAERQRRMGGMSAAAPAPVVPADDGTAFGRGIRRGVPQALESLAAGAGALGFEQAQEYLSGIASERQMELLRQNPELLEGVDFRDIRGVSSFLTYLGELAGEQAPLIGATVLGTGAAVVAGASLPVATAIGTVAASGPLLFGSNVQRQAEALGVDPSELSNRDVTEAAATAVGQTALEAATNALLVARVGAPIARQLLQNAGAEAIAEVGQQALERAQAGLDVDSPDAYEEYLQAGFAGAALGGAFTGVSAAAGAATGQTPAAIREREALGELERDQTEEAARNTESLSDIEARPQPTEFGEGPSGPAGAIALPAPEAQTEAQAEAEWKKGFRQYARERVKDVQPVSLRDLPVQEARAIRAARQAAGITNQNELSRRATLSEIQATLGTDAATREITRQKPMVAPETAFAPIENKSFTQQQFDAVLDGVRATGKINFPEVKKTLQLTQRDPVPTSMVNDVLTEASRRGLVQRTAKPRKGGGTRFSYQLSPALTAAQTEGSITQRQKAEDQRKLEETQLELTRLREEARRIEQTGLDLEGKKKKSTKSQRDQIAKLESERRMLASNIQRATATAGREPAVQPIQTIESSPDRQRRDQQDQLKLELANQRNAANEAAAQYETQINEQKRRASEAQKAVLRGNAQAQTQLDSARAQIAELQAQREVARSAALRGEPITPPATLRYTPRFEGIVNNLKARLQKLGLSDVSLKIEGLINQDAAVEGVYTPQGRIIKLASSLHDSNLSDAELQARLAEVMDHEILHALWEMGLLTDAERNSLIKAAGERQYVAMVNGKPTKRKYTYLQRAQRMYADQNVEIQQEEAIAEMFRNYASGRDKFAGRPQNVFSRIVNFFKSFSKAATQEGAQSPADIFEGIQRGEIGARERAAQPVTGERESRRIRYDNPGGDWLANKRLQADQRMAQAQPNTSEANGVTGSITAHTANPDNGGIAPVTLPVSAVRNLPGANNEQPRPGQPKYDELLRSVQREGFRDDAPILIGVNHRGTPFIKEGNNRVAVAAQLGIPTIRAEVQWYNGGEEFATDFSPAGVQAMSGARESRRVTSSDVQSAQQKLAQDPGFFGLSPSMVSRINPIYRPGVLPKSRMPSNREAALWLEGFFDGVPITDFTATLSPEQIREIATIMAAEAQLALQNSGNAFDWYSTAMASAIDIASVKYPMLSSDAAAADAGLGTAANARFVFTYIMAVTSQNLGVRENAKATDERFTMMLDKIQAGNYDMPESWGTGDKREAMGKNFKKFGPMVNAMPGETFPEKLENLDALFRESKTVKEWEADLKAAGIPYSPPGQTAKDAVVYGSSTLGPKIGNGFWQNLNGNYTPLTIDLWMRRTWGRLTGKSIGNPEALPEQRQRFKDGVERSRSRLRGNKEEIARITSRIEDLLGQVSYLKGLNIKDPDVKARYGSKKNITEEMKQVKNELADMLDVRPDLLGIKAPEKWQSAYNRDNAALLEYAKRSLKPWEAEYKKLRTRLTKEEIADVTPTWVRAAKTIVTNLGKPLDQVANGTQRKQIEEAGRQALEILNSRGISLTNADLQAILWYPEKDLWGSLASELNVDEDGVPVVEANPLNESYDGTFARILEEQGYNVSGRDGRSAVAGSDAGLGRPGSSFGAGGVGIEGAGATGSEPQGLATSTARDGARDAGDRAGTQTPVRESRRPTQRPDAEAGFSELDPVTADDLKRLTELREEFFRRPGWAVVTATREDIDPRFKTANNVRFNDQFRNRLNIEGIPYLEISGTYKGEPQGVSFLIIAPESTAVKYGKELVQESILTNEGLVYTLRPLPPNRATGDFAFDDQARADDFFSETPEGFAFSMGLDFDLGPGVAVFPENAYERTDRPQLPIRKSDNKVELLHWSNQNLTSVDPAFAGTGPLQGVERRRGARLGFFGINPRKEPTQPGTGYVKESGLGPILHRALVDPDDLYPWVSDPAKFKKDLTGRTADERIQEIEDRIRNAGYKGYYVEDDGNVRRPSAPLGNVAAMFEAIPVEPVSQERQSRRPMYSMTARMNAASGTNNANAIHKQMTQYTDVADWLGRQLGYVFRKPGDAQQRADKFIQRFQDSFIPVARMVDELKKRGMDIIDVVDPYLQEQLSRSRAGGQIDERKRTIYRTMTDAVKGLDVSDTTRDSLISASAANATHGRGLAAHMFKNTESKKQALAEIYLYAKHALERNEYINKIDPANNSGSGMSDAEARAIIDWFNTRLGQQNRSAIARIEAAAKAIVADTNAVRVDGNLIPSDMINVVSNKKNYRPPEFENYVPLRGKFDDDDSVDYNNIGGGRGFSVSGREDPRALGRSSYGGDVIANLLFQNSNSIIRAEQNKVALSLADLLEANPQETSAYGKILKRAPQRRILNPYGMVQYTVDQGYKQDPNIVIAKRNGEEIIIEMEDANLAGAFNGKNVWNAGHANAILRGLGKLNRYLSNIVTSWNPEFGITNFFRDMQSAGVNISEFEIDGLRKDVMKNVFKAMGGMQAAIRKEDFSSPWAQRYREFTMAGGQSAANPMNNLQDQIDDVASLMKDFGEGGSVGKMRRSGKKVLDFLEDYNTVIENAVRLTTYDALRKRGYSEARAAQAARSVTVDFTKTGDMGQFMNSLYLFYNAALQGSFFMFRAAGRSKRVRRILAGAIATGAVMDMINSMVSGEDEAGIDEYDKIPDYVLEHNWVIMLPEGMAPDGRRYIAIPMPYGLNFFYNTGRAIARTGRGGYEVDQGASSIASTLLEVINPVGGTEHFLNFVAPTIADPFISLYGTNIDFTGRDIRREPMPGQEIAQSHLYWNGTSPTAVGVAQALNAMSRGTPTLSGWADVSPNTLEFWFDYVTGGAGRFVQRTVELPMRVSEAQSNEDIIREVPVIRRLFGSVSSREDLGTYIRERDRVLRARSEFRDAMDAGDRERAMRARERFPDQLRIAEQVNTIENQRRAITRRINDITANPRIPEDRKREVIDRLDEQRQRIILRGLQVMRAGG